MINVRNEVEAILGRKMTSDEDAIYLVCRNNGYANPFDIVNQLKK